MITVHYPCENCTDDSCGEGTCDRYSTAAGIICASTRLARVVRDSALPDAERARIGNLFADAISEALGICSARWVRSSFLAACNLEVSP